MNIKIEDLVSAEAKSSLSKEIPRERMSAGEKLFDDVESIFQNIAAIEGEKFCEMVRIGMLIHKNTQLITILSRGLEGEGPKQQVQRISALLGAQIMTHALKIGFSDPSIDFAKKVTYWTDKIMEAEAKAIESIGDELFGDN